MVMVLGAVGADLLHRRLLAGRGHVQRVLRARQSHVDDPPALADRKLHRRRAR